MSIFDMNKPWQGAMVFSIYAGAIIIGFGWIERKMEEKHREKQGNTL